MFANQLCCQYDCLFNVRIDGRFTQICSKYAAKNRMSASAEHLLNAVPGGGLPHFPNDMPEWASRNLNQAKVYGIPSINAIYSTEFLRSKVICSIALCYSVHVFLAGDFLFPRGATITVRGMPHTSKSFLKERKCKMIANRICALRLHPAWLIANRGHKKRSKMFGRRNP